MVTASPAGQASTTSTSTAAHALPPNTSHAATTNKTAASLRMSVPIHFIAPAAVSARLGTRAMRTPAPLWERLQAPPLRRQGRVGEGCFLGSDRTVETPSTPPPAPPPNPPPPAPAILTASRLRMSSPIPFIAPSAVSARLCTRARRTPAPLWERLQAPPLRRQGRVGEGCFLGSARTVDTPSQPPPAFAGGGATAKLAAEAAPQDQERDRASGYPREGISNPRRTAGRASPRSGQADKFPKRSNSTSSRAS